MASSLKLVLLFIVLAFTVAQALQPTATNVFNGVENTCKSCDSGFYVRGTFMTDDSLIGYSEKHCSTFADCCRVCASTDGCTYFSFGNKADDPGFEPMESQRRRRPKDTKVCKLYNSDACDNDVLFDSTCPFQSGGNCNGNSSCHDDPHFVGAQGVKYDFNGVPGRTFCLITDPNIHINIRLSGYYVPNADGTQTVRSWIRELVYFWHVAGESYTLQLVARSGKVNARSNGFMETIIFNGKPLGRLGLKDKFSHEQSGLELELKAYETLGPYQVDAYHLSILGLIDADVRLRVAHPKLQLADDAETHLNLRIRNIDVSSDVHGVLGQTYRGDRKEVTEKFKRLVKQLHAPIKADGADGEGFLDGLMEDYETGGPLSTACKFDRYNPVIAEVVSED